MAPSLNTEGWHALFGLLKSREIDLAPEACWEICGRLSEGGVPDGVFSGMRLS
jgi:hypothetical protein